MALIAQLSGGLGNQLFQYAAGRALALRTGMTLKLDVSSGFRHDTIYKRRYLLDRYNINAGIASGLNSFAFPGSRTFRKMLRNINRCLPMENRFYLEEKGFMQPSQVFDPAVLAVSGRRLLFMEGYWQCEKYFEDFSAPIREEFVLAGEHDDLTMKEARLIESVPAIAVGIRSYSEVPEASRHFHVPLGTGYYLRAINMIRENVPNAKFFVFSDNPDWARSVLPQEFPSTFIESRSYEKTPDKLWLMSLCRHFVISNSSFHWWGAWLSGNKDKIVIAPSSCTNNQDMFPATWLKIDPVCAA